MVDNGLTKALSSAQKHNFFIKVTAIKDQKNLLASIKKEKDAFKQLEFYPEYNKIYGFDTNAT